MRSDTQWFALYGESHQNKTNKKIHYICVPLILYNVLGIADAISQQPYLNLPYSLTLPILIGGGLFYLLLNWKLGAVTLSLCYAMIVSFRFYPDATTQFYLHLGSFAMAWIFQFIGHKIEGKKPSFLNDLVFLLIGPLWIVDQWTGHKLRSAS